MPELSVVVVTMKDRSEIEPIARFERSDFEDYEVILRRDEGISRARNAGIREADAEKVAFVDDDAVPLGDYLAEAAAVLDDHAAVAGRVVHPDDDVFGEIPTWYDQGDEPGSTGTLVGCNMAFRTEVFDAVGGFDEGFEWGHDETEFSDRLREEYDVHYDPALAVRHPYATSHVDYWRKKYRLGVADVHYWDVKGIPRRRQLVQSLPLGRLGTPEYSPPVTVADAPVLMAGANVAQTLGRWRGHLDRARSGR